MQKNLSSGLSVTLFVLVPVILIVGFLSVSYNGIVSKEEEVFGAWSQVESNYQRRADLVPNLVKTVQAYADHERQTLKEVTVERTAWLNPLVESAEGLAAATADADKATVGSKDKLSDEEHMKAVSLSQKAVTDKLTRFMGVVEGYPSLRASDNFLALQDQLEGAENRINTARMAFNDKAREFNASIRRIPGSLMAGLGGFKRKAYFEADQGAEKAPEANFAK